MEDLLSFEDHSVPMVDGEHDESLLEQQENLTNCGQSLKLAPSQMSLSADEQIKNVETFKIDDISFESFSEEAQPPTSTDHWKRQGSGSDDDSMSCTFLHCTHEVPSTPQKAAAYEMHNNLKHIFMVDECSSSSGSSDSYNRGSSASCDSSSDEVPNFTWSRSRRNEKCSAANEVVSGRQFPFCVHDTEKATNGLNVVVSHNYPREQTFPSSDGGTLLLPNDTWPTQLENELKPDDDAVVQYTGAVDTDGQPVEYTTQPLLSVVESLPVPVNNQEVEIRREMVTGLAQPSTITAWDPSLISHAFGDQHHFLEKSVDAIGRTLNTIVSSMHDDPMNSVKFFVRKKIFERREKSRRTSVTEKVAVECPLKSPEAFDGRCVLRHMRSAYREYSDALDYHSSSAFRNLLAKIIGRIPKRRNSSFTWAALLDTLFHMRWLIESVIEGLECTDRFSLSDKMCEGLKELKDITESAKWTQMQLPNNTK